MEKLERLENIREIVKDTVAENINLKKVNDQVANIKAKLDQFISKDEAFWMSLCFFLIGVIIGMIISPKGNTSIGCDNHIVGGDDDDEDEEEEKKDKKCRRKSKKCCE